MAELDVESLSSAPLTQIRVQALVLFKIVKHCRELFPVAAQGHLVGLSGHPHPGVLEVTHAFPTPSTDENTDPTKSKTVASWLKQLGEVDIDKNSVGWYMGAYLGSFLNSRVVEEQVLHQQNLNDRSVVLVYDISRASQGQTSLHAYRLGQAFLDAHKEGKFTSEVFSRLNLTHKDIFYEIPIVVEQSHLQSAFLQTILNPNESNSHLSPNYSTLDLAIDPYLENDIEYLLGEIDDWKDEQGNLGFHQRQNAREWTRIHAWQAKRRTENAERQAKGMEPLREDEWTKLFKVPTEVNRFESLLLNAQIDQYCKQIDVFSGATIPKMYAVKQGALDS